MCRKTPVHHSIPLINPVMHHREHRTGNSIFAYEHQSQISYGVFTKRLAASFSDDYFLDIYNRDSLPEGVFDQLPSGGNDLGVQKTYQMYDASLRFEPVSEEWLVELYVKNLTDEDVKLSSGNFITEKGFVATYLPPRTYGVNFRYSF